MPMATVADKIRTGIIGFDDVLNGGLRRDRVYLVEGDPGTSKNHLSAPLDHAQNRRLVLLQPAPAWRSRQSATPSEPPLFATAAGWPLCPATT